MKAPRLLPRSTLFVSIWVMGGASAFAQPSTPAQTADWSIAAGYGTFALRDIARTTPPVDASPVAWQGSGPTFVMRHTRTRGSRLHRLQVEAALMGNFAYRTPTRSVALAAGETFRTIEGRYEYRRRLFADRLLRGLNIDLAAQGIGSLSTFTHAAAGDLVTDERILATGPAVVAGVRLRRWSGVGFDVDWINGMLLGRFRLAHTGDELTRSRWGGGWLEDLNAAATIRLTPRTALAVRYADSGGGLLSSHQQFATARKSFAAGVTYVR